MNTPQAPNPFADQVVAAPRRANWKGWLWVLVAVWGGATLLMMACGGFTYFAVSTSEGSLEKFVMQEIERHPEIEKRLGPVHTVSVLPTTPFDRRQGKDGQEQPDYIVVADGSKGRGFLWMHQSSSPSAAEFFSKIELHLPSGEKVSVK